jgi:hypothetical protein
MQIAMHLRCRHIGDLRNRTERQRPLTGRKGIDDAHPDFDRLDTPPTSRAFSFILIRQNASP